jgi:hypothetical protein
MAMDRVTAGMAALLLAGLVPGRAEAAGYELRSLSAEYRFAEQDVVGEKTPESFREYAVRATIGSPLEYGWAPNFVIAPRVLGSVGVFEGPAATAAVVSLVPLLAVGTRDGRYTLDGGLGLALLSEHHYGRQDFGGPAQFALTAGLQLPVYRRFGFQYRFMHYSDAGAYGPETVGADLHLAGVVYRFN